MRTVAALYVDPRGPYPKMPGVDCWDESRDAKLYDGPWPVVAHPPCGPWGKLAFCSKYQPHDCAPTAVDQVRTWGGVLEHPAGSVLFAFMGLPRPGELPDAWGGRTVEVEQVRWGHVARKRTWLYLVGVTALGEHAARLVSNRIAARLLAKRRVEYRKQGLCVLCGRERAPGHRQCEKCIAGKRASRARQARRDAGEDVPPPDRRDALRARRAEDQRSGSIVIMHPRRAKAVAGLAAALAAMGGA